MAEPETLAEVPEEVSPEVPNDVAGMTFERALEELEQIVRRLEAGQGSLDEAIGAYERGAHLKRHCETKLKEAKARVEKISFAANGTPELKPAEID